MTKREVIFKLFTYKYVPAYAHTITGEKFPYDKYWNEVVHYTRDEVRSTERKARHGDTLNDREERMLLSTGWIHVSYEGAFDPERFAIL